MCVHLQPHPPHSCVTIMRHACAQMGRMDALIQHLAACRPSKVKAGLHAQIAGSGVHNAPGSASAPHRAASMSSLQQGQGVRGGGGSLLDAKPHALPPWGSSGAGGKTTSRSASAARQHPGYGQGGGGGSGPGRPLSAPRMRQGVAGSPAAGMHVRRTPSSNLQGRPPLYI